MAAPLVCAIPQSYLKLHFVSSACASTDLWRYINILLLLLLLGCVAKFLQQHLSIFQNNDVFFSQMFATETRFVFG